MCWRPLEYRVYTNIFAHKYRSCIIVRDIDRGETNPGIGDVLLKKKIIFLMIASVFLAFSIILHFCLEPVIREIRQMICLSAASLILLKW